VLPVEPVLPVDPVLREDAVPLEVPLEPLLELEAALCWVASSFCTAARAVP